MTRDRFNELIEEALDNLPERFRNRVHNVAVLVEDLPPEQLSRRRAPRPRSMPRRLVMGVFIGTPATQKSVFDQPVGPDYIVLYQKNIEAVCRTESEIRDEIRQTVMHELGHYFGLSEDELMDV
ncbi:MAG TPA: metallopeptidase family protein [Terriglobales bacterium]|nr:metallopeptidase family protein [Terriglobales bacterium]